MSDPVAMATDLEKLCRCFHALGHRMQALPRVEKRAVAHAFVAAGLPYVAMARDNVAGLVHLLSFAARGLYELSLLAKAVFMRADGVAEWNRWFAKDKIDVLEALAGLDPTGNLPATRVIRDEIARLESVAASMHVVPKKCPSVADLARHYGDSGEHRPLFGLLSKLVHPTAYLIGSPTDDIHGAEMRVVLIGLSHRFGSEVLETILASDNDLVLLFSDGQQGAAPDDRPQAGDRG